MMVSRETKALSVPRFLETLNETKQFNVSFLRDHIAINCQSLSAIGIILLARLHFHEPHLIVSCSSFSIAEQLYRQCYNLCPELLYFFPEDRTQDNAVPGFNLEQDRYRAETSLFIYSSNNKGLIITTLKACQAPYFMPESHNDNVFSLSVGAKIVHSEFIKLLTSWGFEQSDTTITPKTFSLRGGIIDVFLLHSSYPLRIELFGSKIESLRLFNPLSQRRVENINSIDILAPSSALASSKNKKSLANIGAGKFKHLSLAKQGESFSLNTFGEPINHRHINCESPLSDGAPNGSMHNNNNGLSDITLSFNRGAVYAFIESSKQQEQLSSLLGRRVVFVEGILEKGFYLPATNIGCISYSDVFNHLPQINSRWSIEPDNNLQHRVFSKLEDLDWGAYLVHKDFGIGVYRGMHKVKNKSQVVQECIKIEYANGGLVYVPLDRFSKVHKLIGSGKKDPALASLGTNRWNYQKRKAKESAQKIVNELVSLQASKTQDRGFVYDPNDRFYYALVSTFPFVETADQTSSIQATIRDMENPKPMDRLICGDVGFGKTEVALRAAIKAIASGKQVLLLAPTTILADQHFISTKLRFDPLGVRVELLSRFKTKKEQINILNLMQRGQVDIVIGTHRLLSEDIQLKDLGLLIINEEHRFGVKHKEKIRLLKENVDVLTLSATPIPRTLQQALAGYRDISRIMTPPKTRKPIRTFIEFFHWDTIQKALNYEISRNGQAYFLHNNITELPFYYKKIKAMFPDRAVAVAHGQTPSRELEKIILSYFNGGIDILICTTIIESGLDVSNANTIIINSAHKFGLSQLYQIRGRVGRSYRQAYCYLVLPRKQSFGSAALQRLKAIEQFTSLGSGYEIATKDLEIRGAGNLFGYQQSGHISSVGFEMYCALLQEALDESSGNVSKRIEPTRIIIEQPALLESDYVPLAQDRLYFYQQLAETNKQERIKDLELELKDRFGLLPDSASRLLVSAQYRVGLSGSSVSHLYLKKGEVKASLRAPNPFNSPEDLIAAFSRFAEKNNQRFKLSAQPNSRLELSIHSESWEQTWRTSEWLVSLFSI